MNQLVHQWEKEGVSITWVNTASGANWPIDAEGWTVA